MTTIEERVAAAIERAKHATIENELRDQIFGGVIYGPLISRDVKASGGTLGELHNMLWRVPTNQRFDRLFTVDELRDLRLALIESVGPDYREALKIQWEMMYGMTYPKDLWAKWANVMAEKESPQTEAGK